MIEIKKFKFTSNLDFVYQGLREKKISCKVDWENNILYCEEKNKEIIIEYINSLNLDESDVEVDESVIEGYEEWNKNMYNIGHYTGGKSPFFQQDKNNYKFYAVCNFFAGLFALIELTYHKNFSKTEFWILFLIISLISFSLYYQYYKFKETKK